MQQGKCYVYLIFLLTLLPFKLQAQLPGYKEFRPGDNNTRIFSLLRSSNGYLFAGTSNGLFKFDGISFSKIEINKPESTDSVTAVFQDNNNHIWIGCNSGRIAKAIDRKLQYIEPEEGTPKKRITSFVQDKEGNIWFGTAGEGLYHFYNNRLFLVNDENGLSDLNIHSLAVTEKGEVLAATDQGVNICSPN